MKILILDNYDSFTYNLVHYVEKVFDGSIDVYRNDKIDLKQIDHYDKIIFSPGPGLPSQAGIMLDVIRLYADRKSMLGVCLGHQAIAEAFGGSLVNLKTVFHGVATITEVVKPDPIFNEIPPKFKSGRYHSWVVDKNNFPDSLEIIASDESANIMALRHKKYDIKGVQFHPESILTEYGEQIIKNWIG